MSISSYFRYLKTYKSSEKIQAPRRHGGVCYRIFWIFSLQIPSIKKWKMLKHAEKCVFHIKVLDRLLFIFTVAAY